MAIEHLEILFGPDLDGGTPWRHRLGADTARAGWLPCGPLGLVERLGLVLGEPVSPAPRALRVAAYGARLRARLDAGTSPRTWATSWTRDPVGVAGYLLGLRDRLRMAGWEGEAVPRGGDRLADLADLEEPFGPPVPPGLPDALVALRRAAEQRDDLPLPMRVHVTEAPSDLEPAVRGLLEALEARGARVLAPAPPRPGAPPDTDLARLQHALLEDTPSKLRLRGDGTVIALDAETPADAAELLAAWQRDHFAERTTVVATAERGALASGFARQGLSSVGAVSRSRWRPALQVLPLRLALAFRPVDPLVAAELLSLPVAPLPGRVRRRLLKALGEAPGVGGPAWREAVDECVERADEPEDLRDRIDAWFGGPTWEPEPGMSPTEASAVCERVIRWARGLAAVDPDSEAQLLHAAGVAADLRRMLHREPPDEPVGRARLQQLHDEAVGAGLAWTTAPREAGRPAVVDTPRGVLPGAERVVWWGFVDGTTPDPGPEPWTDSERRALHEAGVGVPAAGARRRVEAASWRRPVLVAERHLVLVRWRLDGREATLPHPFADELEARLGSDALAACRVRAEDAVSPEGADLSATTWTPEAGPVEPARPVTPRPVWRVSPEHVEPPPLLSPTAVEKVFGCPLQWVLADRAKLRPGAVASIPEGDRLVGLFAHALLQDLVVGDDALDLGRATPDEAAARAGEMFDARVGGEAAPLLRPGHEVERERARSSVASAARELVAMLQRAGWRPVAAERETGGTFEGHRWRGYVDLLLESPEGRPAVVDLKLGHSRNRREELAEGRALQLAMYADGVASGDALPPVAYMTVGDGRFLTTDGEAFPESTAVEGPSSGETLVLAGRAWRWWRSVLSEGVVPARHDDLEGWKELCEEVAGGPPPDEGPAARKAPCCFCDFAPLCTLRHGEDR
ncbi:MAG: PD-(D/E)XK nuclease family protein [Myxococcota bacterium]